MREVTDGFVYVIQLLQMTGKTGSIPDWRFAALFHELMALKLNISMCISLHSQCFILGRRRGTIFLYLPSGLPTHSVIVAITIVQF